MSSIKVECASNIPYEIDLSRYTTTIRKASRIVVQLPEGLKQYTKQLVKCIEDLNPDAEVIVQGDPTYGACDLMLAEHSYFTQADLILHVGHTPYPVELGGPRGAHKRVNQPKILYVPAFSKAQVEKPLVEDAARILENHSAKRVRVTATIQHANQVPTITDMLASLGFEVEKPKGYGIYLLPGQVLGCDYRTVLPPRADAYVHLGGGRFHPLGLYLATRKPVAVIDPYRREAWDLTGYGEKILRKRLYKVFEAMDAKNWALIAGYKSGQYRPWLIRKLKKMLDERSLEYNIITFERLLKQDILNLADLYDAFVITSCPRLPIDDLDDVHKPVLTPGEAEMALTGKLDPYRFPW
jgi:2-(3-amino-3-carboxypropyl)histidine synthase